MTPARLDLVGAMLSLPTAPFHEQAVIDWVRRWALRHDIAFGQDAAGNVLLRYGRRRAGPPWVFAAHMDHPGFVVRRSRGRTVLADFLGSVAKEYFVGSMVRFLAGRRRPIGRIAAARPIPDTPWRACRVELTAPADLPPGTLGQWRLPAFRRTGRRISAPGCDDVAGCAAVLLALGHIAARRIPANVIVLLTRAEEAAFIGALAACRHRSIPAGAYVVAVETSQAQPQTPLGCGAIVRIGDKVRTFDPSLTAHVSAVAERLAERDRQFRFLRQLMPGGTCEATAYVMHGYRATGLCVPLVNYHNQGPRGIAPERIDAGDLACLVKLLVAIAADGDTPAYTDAKLRARLRHLLATRGQRLRTG